MFETYLHALEMVLDPYVLVVIVLSAIYGLLVGCIPGLSATMATALLVPITFYMPAVPAIGAIVTCSAMAIFSGDIPATLLRIPGTPSSAAYVEDAYNMTRKGKPELALGISVYFSAIGGLFGTIVMMIAAPSIADFALSFGSAEFFWLVVLGLSGAIFIASANPAKALAMLAIGLFISSVGMNNAAGMPRFTLGQTDLLGGISLVPMMVGLFACSEVLRHMISDVKNLPRVKLRIGPIFTNMFDLTKQYPWQTIRGSIVGLIVGVLPGAGADIAAWMSYAISKKLSREPEKFGTGHPEGLIEAGASNNSALSGAWIPALVFGIPGDTITAIAIGVLTMKNMTPGPAIFLHNAESVYALFLIFLLANLVMLPLGWMAIKLSTNILVAPRQILMPIILVFAMVGSYSINNSMFDILIMLGFGLFGFVAEENGFPLAPLILGVVLGGMIEENFLNTLIKSDGSLLGLVDRPISGTLAMLVGGIIVWTLYSVLRKPVLVLEEGQGDRQ